MIKHLVAIIWCLAFWGGFITGKSVFAGTWNEKPVMCDDIKQVSNVIRDKGELLIVSGIQLTKVRDPDEANGLSPTPATLPLRMYVNLETKTYTIIEDHPTYESVCIISYGDDFSSMLLDTM